MSTTETGEMHQRSKPGVVIFDRDRRILAITPVAEEMLGWGSAEVTGAHCSSIFDCRVGDGSPACADCCLNDVFEGGAIIESTDLLMQTAMGGRDRFRASFWHLPPAGRITEPRAMAVLHQAQ